MKKFLYLVIIALSMSAAINVVQAAEKQRVILAFGDSLTAGYGMPLEQSFAAQLERKLQAAGHNIKVRNAGVSGDTTSGGLTRLKWTLSLQQKPDFAILELGANDMLRTVPAAVTRDNLQKMIDIFKAENIPVLLAGMSATPFLGAEVKSEHKTLYKELAKKNELLFYPFFLEGVVGKRELLLDDGLHPNPVGVAVIVDGIYPTVEKLIKTP